MCVCVYKICEEKFGGCKKSFSWLGQKVNKKIDGADACGHNANESSSDLCPWPRDGAASWQDNLNTVQYSNRIRSQQIFVFEISRIFHSSEIPYSSHPLRVYYNLMSVIYVMEMKIVTAKGGVIGPMFCPGHLGTVAID